MSKEDVYADKETKMFQISDCFFWALSSGRAQRQQESGRFCPELIELGAMPAEFMFPGREDRCCMRRAMRKKKETRDGTRESRLSSKVSTSIVLRSCPCLRTARNHASPLLLPITLSTPGNAIARSFLRRYVVQGRRG